MAGIEFERRRPRRTLWPLLSLLPVGLGSWAPIIAGRRCRKIHWTALGILWLSVAIAGFVDAAAGPAKHNDFAGLLVLISWGGGIVSSFAIAPAYRRRLARPAEASESAEVEAGVEARVEAGGAEAAGPDHRDRWPWISILPLGIGAWAPIIAGVRCRNWRWTLLGVAGGAVTVVGFALPAGAGTDNTTQLTARGLLVLGSWTGGIVVSFLIRPVYDRRTGWPEPVGRWPEPTSRSRSWPVRYAIVAYVVTFVGVTALGLILRYPLGIKFQVGPSVLVVDAALLAGLIPLARRRGLSRQDLGLRPTAGVRSIGFVLLAFLTYVVVALLWFAIIEPSSTTKAARTLAGAKQPDTLDTVLAVIALAVSAPVVEEIFFRGLLYRSLRNRMSVPAAALIAGCLFGLVHITSYPLDTLPVKAAFGVIACLLYERTGSLLPGIAVHAFVDASLIDAALTGNNFVVLITYGAAALLMLLWAATKRVFRRPEPAAAAP